VYRHRLTGWIWSDGIVYSRTYDDVGRLKTFRLADTTRTLIYDELGNITGWNDSGKDEYNRDYNPATGRYIQSDPIGLDGGMNTFGYVNAAPTVLVDIMGGIEHATSKS
jgi:RHS repeat-associated protein